MLGRTFKQWGCVQNDVVQMSELLLSVLSPFPGRGTRKRYQLKLAAGEDAELGSIIVMLLFDWRFSGNFVKFLQL